MIFKKMFIYSIALAGMALLIAMGGTALATDAPHTNSCTNCHGLHASLGQDLTAYGAISEVCISCHNNSGGLASTKPFSAAMQAAPGISNTSHRWDASMDCVATPSKCGPTSRYGLRKPAANINNPQPDEIQNYEMNFELIDTGFIVTCSVCHDAHLQHNSSWDPDDSDSGTATGGSTTTIEDTSKSWTVDQWKGFSMEVTSGPNAGERRRIGANTATVLTLDDTATAPLYQPFPNPVASGNTYSIYGGNFMIDDNYITVTDKIDKLNRLCEDCHYYRTAGSGQTDVRTYDGNPKSHPVTKIFTSDNGETPDVTDTTQFNTSPLEPSGASWAPQTGGLRYHLNGGTDTNSTNNTVLDLNGKVRCLSCHRIHYADSDATTVDAP